MCKDLSARMFMKPLLSLNLHLRLPPSLTWSPTHQTSWKGRAPRWDLCAPASSAGVICTCAHPPFMLSGHNSFTGTNPSACGFAAYPSRLPRGIPTSTPPPNLRPVSSSSHSFSGNPPHVKGRTENPPLGIAPEDINTYIWSYNHLEVRCGRRGRVGPSVSLYIGINICWLTIGPFYILLY